MGTALHRILDGADVGTRTRDLFLTKEVLYRLSYISILNDNDYYKGLHPKMQALILDSCFCTVITVISLQQFECSSGDFDLQPLYHEWYC